MSCECIKQKANSSRSSSSSSTRAASGINNGSSDCFRFLPFFHSIHLSTLAKMLTGTLEFRVSFLPSIGFTSISASAAVRSISFTCMQYRFPWPAHIILYSPNETHLHWIVIHHFTSLLCSCFSFSCLKLDDSATLEIRNLEQIGPSINTLLWFYFKLKISGHLSNRAFCMPNEETKKKQRCQR